MTSCQSIFIVKLNEDEKNGGDTEYKQENKMIAKKETQNEEDYIIIPIVQKKKKNFGIQEL